MKNFTLRHQSEIEQQFKKIPEAIANTHKIAEECNVDLKLGEYKYPSIKQREKKIDCNT